jgi:hypothetical protein
MKSLLTRIVTWFVTPLVSAGRWLSVLLAVGAFAMPAMADISTGTDTGFLSHTKAFNSAGGTVHSFFAYPPAMTGGVRVAAGDVNGDGASDIITGAGSGVGGHVKVFNGTTGAEIRSFDAYGPLFSGGIFVGGGRIDADMAADIITGSDSGINAHVKAFSGSTGAEIRSFLAYGPGFLGGVRVAGGDVNGDGFADIITGAGAGGNAHVKVFDGVTGAEFRSFLAYGPSFSGGVFVGSGDVNGDSRDDIITGVDSGAASHVKVFSGVDNSEIRSFFAYGAGFSGGVRVAGGDLNGDGYAEIITGAGAAGAGHVKVFDGLTMAETQSFFAYGPSYAGGVFVAGARAIPEPSCTGLLVAVGSGLVGWRRGRLAAAL